MRHLSRCRESLERELEGGEGLLERKLCQCKQKVGEWEGDREYKRRLRSRGRSDVN